MSEVGELFVLREDDVIIVNNTKVALRFEAYRLDEQEFPLLQFSIGAGGSCHWIPTQGSELLPNE